MLHLRLLGPLTVHDGEGRELTPPGGRERNGLATLAVVAPESLSTERLAAELYRERGTSDPRNAVQAMVSRLRRALGRSAGSVETTANGYRLVEVTVDLDEAEQFLREALSAPDLSEAAARLDEAKALWRGPTLEGLEGELVEAERLRIDGLRHDAEDAVLERRVNAGGNPDPDPDLVHDLEAAVRHQPLREQRWALLMLVLYRAGRQADALRAFQRARGLLADGLGLEPGPTLTSLERRILDQDPTLTGPAADQPTPHAPWASPGPPDPATVADPTMAPDPAALPSGTLSVLLCDVEGSVGRWEADPADTGAEIEQLHQVWAEAVEAEAGTVVKSTGDGILAVFETADRAVGAAAGAMAQQVGSALKVRAAIHTGTLEPIGDDYRGPVINRCARILDLVHGGQIVVSGPTADLARGPLAGRADHDDPPPISLRDLGSHWLRDVPEPMALWQVTGPGLAASFPPLPSRDQTSLPRLRGRLLGRDPLVERVSRLVGDQPLVTLLGPGGIGKTSTALAVGWEVLGGRPVSFVDLARVDDPSVVAEHLAEAVVPGGDDDPRPPTDQLAARLATSTELVIIDNAEHLLDPVAEVVDTVLATRLKGSFLVTSRQPLGVADEVVVGVPPLAVPADGDDLQATGRSPAVELFIDRARTLQPQFSVADGLLPVVAHICRRLDGIPLAIELAAGRATLLSIDDIAARLDDQLRLLRQTHSQRQRRHRSLEVVVRWSVDQLSPEARETFDRLSVMAGSFGLAGVEELLARCGQVDIDGLEAIDELRHASLIMVEPGGSRFRMLEPIRQFAAAELAQRQLEAETRQAHVTWITALAADSHARRDPSRAEAHALLDAESDQVLAALSWLADAAQPDPVMIGALAYPVGWWFLTRDSRAGERILGRLTDRVDQTQHPLAWAQVILGLGMATAAHPESPVTGHSLDAVAIFDHHNHPDRGLVRLAAIFAQTDGNDLGRPARLLDEADRLVPSDDRFGRALIDLTMTILRSVAAAGQAGLDDATEAVARGQRAIATFRELGETWALGSTLGELGRLHQRLGQLEEAEACYLQSLELFDGDDNHASHYVLTELARLAADRGQHEQARRLNAEAMRVAELHMTDGCMALTLAGMAYAADARGDTSEAVELYRQAVDLVPETMLELGRSDWVDALARLIDDPGTNAPAR